jgi:hypothetical protein
VESTIKQEALKLVDTVEGMASRVVATDDQIRFEYAATILLLELQFPDALDYMEHQIDNLVALRAERSNAT